jgi:hypothetical protein
MAGNLQVSPGVAITPAPSQVVLSSNYITNFDFLNQYLPDTYEAEFERYGNRSIASFLRNASEQGRLHTKYVDINADDAVNTDTAEFTVNDAGVTACNFRVNQTVFLSDNANALSGKGIITAVNGTTFTVAFYEAGGSPFAQNATVTAFVYGSEFKKGTNGMDGALEAQSDFFEVKPVIIKDKYEISGSDMAQIGWVEVTTENGASGFLWYVKSEHETRLRYEDYLEMMMVEHVPTEAASGAATYLGAASGTDGFFYTLENRGNVWSGGNPTSLGDFDTIIQRLDAQGAIQENLLFVDREFSFDIDDMLAAQNSYGLGGTSYGVFSNSEQMALNLGFSGFKRGYEFYKTDWKYLNDATLRGGINGGAVNGVLVPAGTTTVYDQVLGKNARRPFLHVRYRKSETEDRKMKTWITGSAGGVNNSDLDAMEVHYLSERALCTLGANNFVLFED